MPKTPTRVLLLACLLAPAWRTACAQPAAPSLDEMIRQLTAPAPGAGLTRGFHVRTQDEPAGTPAAPAPAPHAAPAAPPARPWVGVPLLFDTNSAHLKPDSAPMLATMAKALQSPQLVKAKILIEGHTDSSGSAAHNLALSKARADAVKAALVNDGGVDAARLSTIGKGEADLANPSDPLAAENRRVVLVNMSAD